ncbi:MAG: hypothetical protein ABI472_22940 [Ginsengibacter sp.]
MKKFLTTCNLVASMIFYVTTESAAQVAGDFQTRNATGNWSDYNAWNIYNGSLWLPAIPGQLPTATTNVFIQAAQIIDVDDANAVCNNLNVDGATTSQVAFSIATGLLNIKGDMKLSSTGHNCFGTWTNGAKIVFSGTGNQGFSNLSTNAIFENIEVDKLSGTLSTSSNLRFGSFVLTNGNFTVGAGDEIQGISGTSVININGGTWTQTSSTTRLYNAALGNTSPVGAVTINSGTMILSTTTGTGGFQFSSLNIINGGVLTLLPFGSGGLINIGTSIHVDATSTFNTALPVTLLPPLVTFSGVVNYNNMGAQTITPVTYEYLKLSGNGAKTLGSGTTTIPANGTIDMSGIATSPTLVAGGTLNVSSSGTNLMYSSAGTQTATANEWDPNFENITINNVTGVNMTGLSRTIVGSLHLTNGTLNIGAAGALTLDGAALNRTNGYISGTSTSDLSIIGSTGGMVLLPLAADIKLQNIVIGGTRELRMDGSNNINLYGTFTLGANAIYNNGGESDIYKGNSSNPSIIINGKFITKDIAGFYANNAAIDNGINVPLINVASEIEYGLSGDQAVQGSTVSYYHVTFSGSGTKTLASATAPRGTVYITGNAIVQAGIHTFGDNGVPPLTNFVMDGGRLIMSGTNNPQPHMTGAYSVTGGVIEFACPNSSGQTIRNQTYYAIEVTGAYVGNSLGNINHAPNGSFTVKSGASFTINADQITGTSGSQIVTVEADASFLCGNADGFSGGNGSPGNSTSIKSDIENIVLQPGSTVDYRRNNIQKITNQTAYHHLFLSGTNKKTAPAGILTVLGDLTKSGSCTFAHNGGTVLLNGAGSQSFAGLTYNNLIVSNNTKTTAGSSTIIESITINDGTQLSISPTDNITLQSDATSTARIGQLGDGTIEYNTTGKFVVERYINTGSVAGTHGKSWQLLAVPVTTGQTIKEAWQEGATVTNVSSPLAGSPGNPNGGYGTMLTSDIANAASQPSPGFDAYTPLGPSMKVYNAAANNYDGVASTQIPLYNPKGYFILVRGDRSVYTYNATAKATRLRSKGQLFTPTQPPPSTTVGATQFESVGNPYASAIDIRSLSLGSGINSSLVVWDPTISGSYGLGAFQTLYLDGDGTNNGTNNYVNLLSSAAYGTAGTANNYIQSGQGFFIQGVSPAGGTLVFKESDKSGGSNAMLLVPEGSENMPRLRTGLYGLQAGGHTSLIDGTLIHFHKDYTNGIDAMDVRKMNNTSENLSIQSGGKNIVIERRAFVEGPDTIFYNLTGARIQSYRFECIANGLGSMVDKGFIEDTYLHTKTPLNLDGITRVDFNITGVAGSYAPNRFRIIFSSRGTPLPITFTSLKAYRHNDQINLEWQVENERNVQQYEVERSGNGNLYTNIAVREATGNRDLSASYQLTDEHPLAGFNYYRVKGVDINGQVTYTAITKVLMEKARPDIFVWPNPVSSGTISLRLQNQPAGKYSVRLLNKQGQEMATKQIMHYEGSGDEDITPNATLAHGTYQLVVTKPGGSIQVITVVY